MTLSLQSKLFALLLLLIMAIASAIYFDARTKLTNERNLYESVGEIVRGVFVLNIITAEHLNRRSNRTLQQWEQSHDSLTQEMSNILRGKVNQKSHEIRRLEKTLANIKILFFKIQFEDKQSIEVAKKLRSSLISQLNILSHEMVFNANRLGQKTLSKLKGIEEKVGQTLIGAMLSFGTVFLLMTLWVQRSFLTPLLRLRNYTGTLILGDYNNRIFVRGKDEISELSQSFNQLAGIVSKDIAEASSDWSWEIDAELKYIFISNGYEQITGNRVSERIGTKRGMHSNIQDHQEKWDNHLADLMARRPFRKFESVIASSEKEDIHISADGIPLFDAAGKFCGYSGNATNISERKHLEAELLASENRFRASFQSSHGIATITDIETGKFIDVNDAWLELRGFEKHEVIGKTSIELNIWGSNEHRLKVISDLNLRGKLLNYETYSITKAGEVRETIINAEVVNVQGRELLFISGSDITERKLAEQKLKGALKVSEDQQFVLDQHSILATTDVNGLITSVNDKSIEISGYSFEELIGQNRRILNSRYHPKSFFEDLWTTISRGEVWRGEICNKAKDGSIYWVDTTIVPQINSDGKVFQYTAIQTDITHIKQTEELLRRSQKMEAIGELSGGIAHDFNNILGIIVGRTDLSMLASEKGSELHNNLSKVLNAALRGAEMTRRLLSFSRQSHENSDPLDVNTVIHGFEDLIRKSLTSSIDVKIVLAKNLWRTEVNPNDLEDALINLSLNARDAMPDGGNLMIETMNKILDHTSTQMKSDLPPGEYVEICVSDTGVGMSGEIAEKVFDPFFTTKTKDKGTGLGLAMVYGFVKRSNGHIFLYSEEGIGTAVKIHLPRSKTSVLPVHISNGPDDVIPRGTERILIVDDEEELAEIAAAILESYGYATRTAFSGDEGLEIVKNDGPFDLLFSDIVMPGSLNGFDLAEAAVELHPNLNVLLTSGFTGDMHPSVPFQDLSETLLAKPYSTKDLALRVRAALDAK